MAVACLATGFTFVVTPTKRLHKQLKKEFAYIPSGKIKVDQKEVSVQGFYMSIGEVTNKQYRIFLNDLLSKGRLNDYALAQIDSTLWRHDYFYNEPFVVAYHSHPAYDNYPVVNISYEAALLYCQWLTETYQKQGKLEGLSNARFRLPQREEWEHAAKAGFEAPYSWGGYYIRNAKGRILGNFKVIGEENIATDPATGKLVVRDHARSKQDNFFGTAPTRSFFPNDYGLYNMCGNVAEMLATNKESAGGSWNSTAYEIQIGIKGSYIGASPTLGFRPVLSVITK